MLEAFLKIRGTTLELTIIRIIVIMLLGSVLWAPYLYVPCPSMYKCSMPTLSCFSQSGQTPMWGFLKKGVPWGPQGIYMGIIEGLWGNTHVVVCARRLIMIVRF